jgi:hypothetical protein
VDGDRGVMQRERSEARTTQDCVAELRRLRAVPSAPRSPVIDHGRIGLPTSPGGLSSDGGGMAVRVRARLLYVPARAARRGSPKHTNIERTREHDDAVGHEDETGAVGSAKIRPILIMDKGSPSRARGICSARTSYGSLAHADSGVRITTRPRLAVSLITDSDFVTNPTLLFAGHAIPPGDPFVCVANDSGIARAKNPRSLSVRFFSNRSHGFRGVLSDRFSLRRQRVMPHRRGLNRK